MPSSSAPRPYRPLADALRSQIIFVSGKGGVGKTAISQALARALAESGEKTVWICFEDPTQPPGEVRNIALNLDHLNADALTAFEEYAALKIGVPALTKIFLANKLVRYLAKAAPGVHELVLLGKVWHERKIYDRVIVDMPSTGHGVAMFQSVANFARLFQGGPLNRDAEAMLDSFRDPKTSSQIIVGLPEEMPLRESLELGEFLLKLFPDNPAAYWLNKSFPRSEGHTTGSEIMAKSAADYARKRSQLEDHNLRIWREEDLPIHTIPYFPPTAHLQSDLVKAISPLLKERRP